MEPKPRLARATGIGIGVCQMALGGTNYLLLPPTGHGCGNCFLGSVCMPLEIGILCLLLGLGAASRPRPPSGLAFDLSLATLGILLTPFFVGVPIFALSAVFLALALETGMRSLRRCASKESRHPPWQIRTFQ